MMNDDDDDGFSLKWWISQVSRVYSIHPILDHACHDDDDGFSLKWWTPQVTRPYSIHPIGSCMEGSLMMMMSLV